MQLKTINPKITSKTITNGDISYSSLFASGVPYKVCLCSFIFLNRRPCYSSPVILLRLLNKIHLSVSLLDQLDQRIGFFRNRRYVTDAGIK